MTDNHITSFDSSTTRIFVFSGVWIISITVQKATPVQTPPMREPHEWSPVGCQWSCDTKEHRYKNEDGKSETRALHTLTVLVTSGQAEQKPESNPAVRKLQWNDLGLDDTENRLAQPDDQNVLVVGHVVRDLRLFPIYHELVSMYCEGNPMVDLLQGVVFERTLVPSQPRWVHTRKLLNVLLPR